MQDAVSTVLIVDPDSAFARRLSVLLATRGCDVETTGNLAEAAERLKDVGFACVVMDEDLPEIKGHDAVPLVRAVCPGVQIIITAARNDTERERQVRLQNVFFYFIKSFSTHELVMAVCDALRKRVRNRSAGYGQSADSDGLA